MRLAHVPERWRFIFSRVLPSSGVWRSFATMPASGPGRPSGDLWGLGTSEEPPGVPETDPRIHRKPLKTANNLRKFAPLYRCLVSCGNARLRALCCCRKLTMQSSGEPRGVARLLPKVVRAPPSLLPSLPPSPPPSLTATYIYSSTWSHDKRAPSPVEACRRAVEP